VIWNALWDTVCDPGLLWKLIEAYHDRVAGRPTKKKDPAIARIERAQRLVARAYQIFKDPDCPVPYAQAKADFEAAKKELAEAQIGGRAAVIELPNRKDVEAMSAAFQAMRHEVTEFADRKAVLNLLIAKILWADGEAEIHCHLPVENAGNCHSRIGPDSERKRNYSDDCETRISSH
jgi:hypothetical protein